MQLEESLMQALRQIEATIDSVVSVLSNSIPGFVTASSAADAQVRTSWTLGTLQMILTRVKALRSTVGGVSVSADCIETLPRSFLLQNDNEAESAANLVQEVYELVADNYLDARSGGFDPQR